MTKRAIRKEAYKSIVKEGKSHQETYDNIKEKTEGKSKFIADEISKFPSSGKADETKTIRYVFIGLLVLVGIMRAAGLLVLNEEFNFPMTVIAIGLLFSLLVPILGVFTALTHRVNNYNGVAILLALSILRSFRDENMVLDEITMIVLLPYIAVIALAFYIPSKLKTPYRIVNSAKTIEGKERNIPTIKFEDTRSRSNQSEVLDSGL
jgi:hypothetical protein